MRRNKLNFFVFVLKFRKSKILINIPTQVFNVLDYVNFVLKEDIQSGEIKNQIMRSGKGLIKQIEPVNIFLHDSLGKGMKSILFKLVFQSDTKTLEDKEVNPIIDEIISVVGNNFGGKLRA